MQTQKDKFLGKCRKDKVLSVRIRRVENKMTLGNS